MQTSSPVEQHKTHILYKKIDNSQLLNYAKNKLPPHGTLEYEEANGYYYLKIHDDFILKLFPLIQEDNISMPDYFLRKNGVGSHISVIYPNEIINKKIEEVNQSFSFEINGFIKAYVLNKLFFALTVSSPELEQLRVKYGLPTKLNYHGALVSFHITIVTVINTDAQ